MGRWRPLHFSPSRLPQPPYGRDLKFEGHPLKISEMVAMSEGAVYVERTAVNSPANIKKAKKAIRKAFQTQIDGLSFSLVEILSPCPTNWKMTPLESWKWVDTVASKVFPLRVIKDSRETTDAD